MNQVSQAVEQTVSAVQEAATTATSEPEELPLLPPGAGTLSRFQKDCTRCGACLEACDPRAIHLAGNELGAHEGFPVMTPEETPCKLCDGLPCIAACPEPALSWVTREQARIGLAEINPESCYVFRGQPCDYCVTRCPLKQKAIRFDEQGLPEIIEDGCTGCGECAWLCPPNAIEIVV